MSGFAQRYEEGEPASGQPIPIIPAISDAGEFPIEALGPKLQAATEAIVDVTQAPVALAANSVLAASSLAVQAYVDVKLPTGEVVPTSLFMVSVGESGERKSSVDKRALRAVREREREMRIDHGPRQATYAADKAAYAAALKKAQQGNKGRDEIRYAIEACGAEPIPPAQPLLISDEGTMQGLQKLFAEAMPSLGLFSDEGGQWLGGHSMQEENQAQTGAALSKLWDGAPIKRVRQGDVVTFLPGRRLALHLMVQGRIARRLFGNEELRSQGLLSRFLICQPKTTKGTRLWRDPNANSEVELERYHARIYKLLCDPMPMDPETRELTPRALEFTPEARVMWIAFHDAVEVDLLPTGKLVEISGFAAKLPEHAARIAGVITLIQDRSATIITDRALANGIKLAQYYANEALRVIGFGSADEDAENAALLIAWIREKGFRTVGKRYMSLNAYPRQLRPAKVLSRSIELLAEHGHLHEIKGGAAMPENGVFYKNAWTVVVDE
jgi:hypothetical protein